MNTKLQPWIICFTASLFFFYEFIQLNMLNAMSSELMQTFNLNATQFGRLSAFYFYANILFLLPAGIILDRVSIRKIILIALSTCVLGTFAFALSPTITLANISRFLTGIGSAFCFLSCIRLASHWFPAQRMALISGLIVTMAMLGGVAAQTPMTFLTAHFGWRHAVMIDGAIGIIILVLIFCVVRDYPSELKQQFNFHQEQLYKLGYWRSLRLAYFKRQNWLCGTYTCLLNLPIFILGGFLGNQYLQRVHHLNVTQASLVSSMLFFGTIFGSPFMGWFSDRLGLRRAPMIICALLALLIMLAIMKLSQLNFLMLFFLFLLLGFITSAQVISYPTVAESNSKLLTATAVSVISISAIAGGAIFDPFFGWLIDFHAKTSAISATPIYSANDFQFALWLFPFAFVVGLIAACWVRETHCQRVET